MIDFDFPTFARGFIAQYAEEAKHFIRSTVPDLSPRDALARPSPHFEAGLVADGGEAYTPSSAHPLLAQ